MENRRAPKLRFRGFTDDWEQRKLGEMGNTYSGLSGKSKEDFGHGAAQFVTYMNVFSNPVANTLITENVEIDNRQSKVEYGDAFFTTSSETPDEVGMSSVWLGNADNTYLNSFCFGYRPVISINPYYLAYMLRSDAVRKDIVFLAQGISRYNISKNRVMDIDVHVPSLSEQEKIGNYFKHLDHLITLHQRKYDMLQKVKKSMLEKMFPKNGSKVPEIRFAGFTDDWEQRKLSDFAQKESTFRMSSSDFPSVEYEDIVAEEGRLNKDIRLKDVQKIGIFFDGTNVLYGKLRPYLHKWFNPHFEGVAVGDWWVLKPMKIDTNFLYLLIQTKQFDKVANQSTGSKMPRADWNLVSNTEYLIPPTLDEQSQVAETFKDLDHLITLHQRKLEKLKKLKKSMREEMFV